MTTKTNETPTALLKDFTFAPVGGVLVDRLTQGDASADLLSRAASLPKISLDARTAADAELIATGVLSPLQGFVGKNDYLSIIKEMRLSSGSVFSIPITLTVPRAERHKYREGQEAALVSNRASDAAAGGEIAGVIAIDEIYDLDRPLEAKEVYRTDDRKHPGVAYLFERGEEIAIGGRVTLARPTIERKFPLYHRDPKEMRALIATRGWRRTVAFQTRNPIHRAHEYLLRVALETVDGLVVHPLVGETKGDDVPATVRMDCYTTLLEKYFPKDRVTLSVFPFAMRYAGPREAVLHAVARQNYGFSHFIVGRDHAGVGNYYGTYDAQTIFDGIRKDELAITPIFFEHSFWCSGCGNVASIKTCPHDAALRLTLSGTRVRELLTAGELPPAEYSRPEVAAILGEAYRKQAGR
ncbi:MAG: sulfate adenylyltransferase [Polyangiales bacterium]